MPRLKYPEAPVKECPECACDGVLVRMRAYSRVATGFHELFTWYRCRICREKFVTRHDGEPDICTGMSTTP